MYLLNFKLAEIVRSSPKYHLAVCWVTSVYRRIVLCANLRQILFPYSLMWPSVFTVHVCG